MTNRRKKKKKIGKKAVHSCKGKIGLKCKGKICLKFNIGLKPRHKYVLLYCVFYMVCALILHYVCLVFIFIMMRLGICALPV